MKLSITLLGLAVGIVVASTAVAAADREPIFKTIWLVKEETTPAQPLSVPPDGIVLKQRLLPIGLVRIKADFVGNGSGDAVPANEELVATIGSGAIVYCSPRFIEVGGIGKYWNDGSPQGAQRCFIDDNGDGVFDLSFFGNSSLPTLPSANGRIRRKGGIAISLPYEKLEVSQFSKVYYVGVQYTGQAKIGTLRRFRLVYGRENDWGYLTSDNIFTKRDSELPKTISVLGSVIRIDRGDGKNISTYVEKYIPPQPFGVIVG